MRSLFLLFALVLTALSAKADAPPKPIPAHSNLQYANQGVFALSQPEHVVNTVTLPLLVMGSANGGTQASMTINLSSVSGADRLWLHVHSPTYSSTQYAPFQNPGCADYVGGAYGNLDTEYPNHCWKGYHTFKAQVRITNSTGTSNWVDLSDANVFLRPEERRWSTFEGADWYPQFTILLSKFTKNLVAGNNTLEFKFNYVVPDPSSGYRVTGVAVLSSAYTGDIDRAHVMAASMIDGTSFSFADPYSNEAGEDYYGPVLVNGSPASAADITAGQAAFEARNTLISWPGGPAFKAACVDCHTRGALDLATFGYEQKAVIIRANQHHGLSITTAQQIAAYVRSQRQALRTSTNAVPVGLGRPWCAPYQPGTSFITGLPFDKTDVFYWAMGSCTTADAETDMIADLFPDGSGGIKLEASGQLAWRLISPDSTLKVYNIRLSFQMPDWNEWLPRVHPIDSDVNFATQEYEDYYYGGELADAFNTSASAARNAVDHFFQAIDGPEAFVGGKPWAGKDCVDNDPPAGSTVAGKFDGRTAVSCHMSTLFSAYDQKQGRRQFELVKSWEVMRTYWREDDVPTIHTGADKRQWVGDKSRSMFDIAPHIAHGYPYGTNQKDYDGWNDASWYTLQVVINSGTKNSPDKNPADWKYHFQHLTGLSADGQFPPFGMVYYMSFVKMLQNGAPPYVWANGVVNPNWRHVAPTWFTGSPFILAWPEDDVRRLLYTALLRAYNKWLYTYPVSAFKRCLNNPESCLQVSTESAKVNYSLKGGSVKAIEDVFATFADMTHDMGVAPATVDSFARRAQQFWPNTTPSGLWASFECNPCGDGFSDGNATLTLTAPNTGGVFQRGETVQIRWTSVATTTNKKIELLKGGLFNRTIIGSTPNDGLYNWVVDDDLSDGSNYGIRISSVDNPLVLDVSNDNFTVGGTSIPDVERTDYTFLNLDRLRFSSGFFCDTDPVTEEVKGASNNFNIRSFSDEGCAVVATLNDWAVGDTFRVSLTPFTGSLPVSASGLTMRASNDSNAVAINVYRNLAGRLFVLYRKVAGAKPDYFSQTPGDDPTYVIDPTQIIDIYGVAQVDGTDIYWVQGTTTTYVGRVPIVFSTTPTAGVIARGRSEEDITVQHISAMFHKKGS